MTDDATTATTTTDTSAADWRGSRPGSSSRRPRSELCHIPPETLGQHPDLQGHVDADRCRVKSLIASALVGFRVRQHERRESISKRAPSTPRQRPPAKTRLGTTRFAKRRSAFRPSSFFLTNPRVSITSSNDRLGCRWLRRPRFGSWQGQFQGQSDLQIASCRPHALRTRC
jgi:hypothetical protein